MDADRRTELEQRRARMQVKQVAENFLTSDLLPYLELLDVFEQRNIPVNIVQLLHLQPDWMPYIQASIQKDLYREYGFRLEHLRDRGMPKLLDALYDKYPSNNLLRYVPQLEKFADYRAVSPDDIICNGLQSAVASLGLLDQDVYLYYLAYAPIVTVSLFDLVAHEHEDLFNSWYGDVLIFPADLNWLIAFSMEDEWYGGQSPR